MVICGGLIFHGYDWYLSVPEINREEQLNSSHDHEWPFIFYSIYWSVLLTFDPLLTGEWYDLSHSIFDAMANAMNYFPYLLMSTDSL